MVRKTPLGRKSRKLATVVAIASALALAVAASAAVTAKDPVKTAKVAELPASVIAAAKKEGSVTWYCACIADAFNPVKKAFEKRYGITLNVVQAAQSALIARYDAELRAGNPQSDVIVTIDWPQMRDWSVRNAFALQNDLPEWKSFPRNNRYKFFSSIGTNAFWLAYNTDKIRSGSITKWEDVLRPEYKGRIALLDPRGTTSVQWVFIGLMKSYGDDFLRRLGDLDPQPVSTGSVGTPLVASGEKWIIFPFTQSFFPALKAANAPVAEAKLTPTVRYNHIIALTAGAKHPNAARVLVNYMLSKSAQAVWHGNGRSNSPIPGIRGIAPLPGKGVVLRNSPPNPADVRKMLSLLGY